MKHDKIISLQIRLSKNVMSQDKYKVAFIMLNYYSRLWYHMREENIVLVV